MLSTGSQIKFWVRATVLGVAVVSLSACAAIYRKHGYVPSQQDLSGITVGVDTRDTVTETVGPPSSSGVLDDSGFYYVSSRVRHYGIRKPQVIERQLVAISFDGSGVVRNIERFGLEQGRVIPLQRRVTDDGVTDKTFLRQLLGNLGNFNPGNLLE